MENQGMDDFINDSYTALYRIDLELPYCMYLTFIRLLYRPHGEARRYGAGRNAKHLWGLIRSLTEGFLGTLQGREFLV